MRDDKNRPSFLPWLLIAATPVLFALATWNQTNAISPGERWLRLFGIPVVAAELCVIVYAILAGIQPLRILHSQPLWVRIALGALVMLAAWTAVSAPARSNGVTWTFIWLVHLLFAICVAGLWSATDSGVRRLVWPAIVAGLLGYALVLIVFVNSIPEPRDFFWERFWLGVTNVRQVGFYSAVGAAAALGLGVTQRQWRSLFWCAAASLFLGLSFWTGTRGSLVAVWFAFILGLIWLPQLRALRAWVMLAGSAAGGAVLSLILPIPHGLYGIGRIVTSASYGTAEGVSSGRASMWLRTWHAILERPLFGYGQGQFTWVVPDAQGFNHPHNVVLQLFLQWGFVGTLIFTAVAAVVARRCLETLLRGRDDDVSPFLVGASLMTMAMYEGTFFHSYPLMMIALSAAFIASDAARGGENVEDIERQYRLKLHKRSDRQA